MAEQAPTPPNPSDNPNGDKPKRSRGKLNQDYSDELAKTRRILDNALDEKYAPIFVKQEVDPQLIPALTGKLERAGKLMAAAIKGTSDVGDAQDIREEYRAALIATIDPIRAAAKRKYRRTAPGQMKTYFVGEPLETNKADLDAIAVAILGQLQAKDGQPPADKLPGIGAEEIKELSDALTDFRDPDNAEQKAQGDASGSRMTLGELIRNIRNDRIELQLAVDQGFPWRDPDSTAIRTVFELPLDRPLSE